MGHGGNRNGAGRKRKLDKFAGPIDQAEGTIRDRLPRLIGNLMALADGGIETTDEEWQAAGLVLDNDGLMLFPSLPTDQLVLIKRKTSRTAPDRQANEYLVNRVMGKPTERHEQVGDAIAYKVYLDIDTDKV